MVVKMQWPESGDKSHSDGGPLLVQFISKRVSVIYGNMKYLDLRCRKWQGSLARRPFNCWTHCLNCWSCVTSL